RSGPQAVPHRRARPPRRQQGQAARSEAAAAAQGPAAVLDHKEAHHRTMDPPRLLHTAWNHRHRQLPHAFRLGALTALLVAVGSAPAAAAPGVLLHLTGGGDRFLDASELDRLRDVPPTDYVLRAAA